MTAWRLLTPLTRPDRSPAPTIPSRRSTPSREGGPLPGYPPIHMSSLLSTTKLTRFSQQKCTRYKSRLRGLTDAHQRTLYGLLRRVLNKVDFADTPYYLDIPHSFAARSPSPSGFPRVYPCLVQHCGVSTLLLPMRICANRNQNDNFTC